MKTLFMTAILLFSFAVLNSCENDTTDPAPPDPCESVYCLNGGACNNGSCVCPSGFEGTNCETTTDPCTDITCTNGDCNNGACDCEPGWKGSKCDVPDFKLVNSGYFGSGGGQEFATSKIPIGGKLISLQVKSGRLVDGIRFVYEDSQGNRTSIYQGGPGGSWNESYVLGANVHLVGISGRFGSYVDNIRFHCSDGSTSELFGGDGGSYDYNIQLDRDDKFAGFIGRYGRVIDAIGLQYWTPR